MGFPKEDGGRRKAETVRGDAGAPGQLRAHRPGSTLRRRSQAEGEAVAGTYNLSKAKLSTRTLEPNLAAADLAWLRLHGDGALRRKEGLLDVLGGRAKTFSKPYPVGWRLPWATQK